MRSAVIALAIFGCVAGACASLVHDIHAHPAYKYSYAVADKHTGDQKSQAEVRDGGVTKGSYSLVQPDGVLRTVNYIVTPHGGFQAQVINKGVAGHPAIIGHGIGHGISGGIGGAGIGGLGGLGVGRIGLGIGGIGGSGASVSSGLGSPVSGGIGGGIGLGAGLGLLG